MPAEHKMNNPIFRTHAIGAILCVLIAASSIYFAGSSIAKRRGLFLSARHELASAKAELNESAKRRGSLAAQVQRLERRSADALDLVPASRLNSRTAEIVALAESVDIRVDSLQPQERITDARVPVQPLLVIGGATPRALARLLDRLGDRMPDIHVQLLEMGGDGESGEELYIRILLYWFVDPAGA